MAATTETDFTAWPPRRAWDEFSERLLGAAVELVADGADLLDGLAGEVLERLVPTPEDEIRAGGQNRMPMLSPISFTPKPGTARP